MREDFRLFKLNRINHPQIINKQFTGRDIPREGLELDSYFERAQKTITMLIDRSLEYQIVNSFGIDSCEKLQDVYNSKEYGDNGEQLINLQNWASGGDHYLKLGTLKSNKK